MIQVSYKVLDAQGKPNEAKFMVRESMVEQAFYVIVLPNLSFVQRWYGVIYAQDKIMTFLYKFRSGSRSNRRMLSNYLN